MVRITVPAGRGNAGARRAAAPPTVLPTDPAIDLPANVPDLLETAPSEAPALVQVEDVWKVQACAWLLERGVKKSAVAQLRSRWEHWQALVGWLPSRSSWTDADVTALATMSGLGLDLDEIEDWLRLGPLEVAVRLTLLSISADRVRQFPLDGRHGSETFLAMLQASKPTGMHLDDLLWWHTGGVLSLDKPYLNKSAWAQWRSVGALQIGMRRAALAAAAGLSPQAAVDAVAAGGVDDNAWRMLAGLRAGLRT